MKRLILAGASLAIIIVVLAIVLRPEKQLKKKQSPKYTSVERKLFEIERLKDPATGEIPEGMRAKEIAFANKIKPLAAKRSFRQGPDFTAIGPYNVGGRTRAVAYDVSNPLTILAGGVSGGMWRSINGGATWTRATSANDHSAVSCIIQDTRAGKTNTWYYGSGEIDGNSATKSFSAFYYGSGIYKSTDNGATWSLLPSTATPVNKTNDWSYVFSITTDPSRNDSDIVLAGTKRGIMRSNDGGVSWKRVLGNFSSDYAEIRHASNGVFYAILTTLGVDNGLFRSTDGINWTKISGTSFPSNYNRVVLAVAPSNPNVVYIFMVTPGQGTLDPSYGDSYTFYKYTYVSGDGSGAGGIWDDRTANVPVSTSFANSSTTFDGYCMNLAVKPDDENVVFMGSTNLFRSMDGFATSSQTSQIGGYDADGYANFNYYADNQHPDQQAMAFHPLNPNALLASTDGGLHLTTFNTATKVIWQSLNNGYQTTQFYGIAIDHGSFGEEVGSGYQDNGSWYSNAATTTSPWTFMRGGDGAYCALESGNTGVHYYSSQRGSIGRYVYNTGGTLIASGSVSPPDGGSSTGGYLFVHPFALDPFDNNVMYAPKRSALWRNSDLANEMNFGGNWSQVVNIGGNNITAVEPSKTSPNTVYVGNRVRNIYKVDFVQGGTSTFTNITNNINNGGYTSCIAAHPYNDSILVAVYSPYNTVSIYYSDDGGQSWTDIEGNLKGDPDPGVPPQLAHIGNGPSFRWAEIIPLQNSDLILVGTSIGLFATDSVAGDSTVWIPQAENEIGNVVVEMIDHRIHDGFTVIGTHGMGAFKAYYTDSTWLELGRKKVIEERSVVKVYPNPASDEVWIEYAGKNLSKASVQIFDLQGQLTQIQNTQLSENRIRLDIRDLQQGSYLYRLKTDREIITGRFIKF
ncbi:MAG TPA: hypothetical protein DDX92_06270 [Flavobacteriales bacterium]|jgi:hypothetical protein|nr:hypothetical protein [Flavobacteriales bacterium]